LKLRPASILLYQHGELSLLEAFPMTMRLALFRSDRETARRLATVSALFRVALGDPRTRARTRPVPYGTLLKVAVVVAVLGALAIATYNMTHGPGGVYSTGVCR
jgi:hypothetical protein